MSVESDIARRSMMRRLQRRHYQKKSEHQVRLQAWIPRDLERRLRAAAEAAGISSTDWVIRAITERLERQE